MAIKFQFNKTSLNDLNKQLKVRTNALPTLKNKESALRMEVKRAKYRSDELLEQLASSLKSYDYLAGLWTEFEPGLISVKSQQIQIPVNSTKTDIRKILFDMQINSVGSGMLFC